MDLGTQDIVDYELSRSEDYIRLHLFLSRVKEKVGYNNPEEVVIDLDQAWKEAAEDVFPNVPIQFCVVHFERVVDRTIPIRNRTHFRMSNSFRDNNRTESVNDKIQMRLNLIRGYKKYQSARNSLSMIVMHYRFNPFESCRDGERNGKCPLNFAGVDASKLDWIVYSQRDRRVLRAL